MLWQKELNTDEDKDEAVYIDILRNTKHPLANFRLNRKKSNVHSLRTRTEGNRKFAQNDFEGAMELYNESICFAEKGSELLSLAYANRSSCFLKLRMYERCLVDIQLAKTANYPERLMPKLEERQRECMKRKLPTVSTPSTEPMLSFEADKKWPCMANVLQIEKNDRFGRLIRANRDIQIGDTILIEEAYIQIVYGVVLNRCENCAKEKMNFIPCDNCVDAMYCSEKCSKNNFHEAECDMMLGSDDCCDGESLTFILRSVIIAINTFPTVNELIEFVEKCRESDPQEIPESVETPISLYRTFFKLAKTVNSQRISDLLKSAYVTFHAIMGSNLGKKFETTASRRFLMHLIIHHGLILRVNAFSGFTDPLNGTFGQAAIPDDDNRQFEKEIHLISSYFNHSCLPNVIKLVKDNVAVCKALLPIKKGEQLFITYIDDETFDMTEKQRNDQLEWTYNFRCKCQFCKNGAKSGQQLQNDPDFKYIVTNLPRLIGKFDIELIREVKGHCMEFLKRHHPHLTASREVAFVLTNLGALMEKELNCRR